MKVDEYDVLIVEKQGVKPDCHIQHDAKRITYIYSGDPLELVAMAHAAAIRLMQRIQIPMLPKAVD